MNDDQASEDDILAGLDFEVEEPEVDNLQQLSDFELASRVGKLRKELMTRHELWIPESGWSEAGRNLHADLKAVHAEQQRRLAGGRRDTPPGSPS